MIEINLLPGGTTRRPAGGGRQLRMPAMPAFGGDPRVVAVGVAAIVVLLGSGYLYWRVSGRQQELQGKVEEAVADSTRLATTIKLVHDLEARQDTIREKIGIIRSVDQRRFVWPHVLDEVSHALPPYTWLTRLSSAEDAPAAPAAGPPKPGAPPAPAAPAGPRLTLEGNTATTQALTRFMKTLEASPMLRDVALITSSQTTDQGRVFLKFTLEARYETPDPASIRTVPLFVSR
ncbi:MAG TPA: PilN domain-containing protein [Longimicrobiaceae bacterium]|nr:PilN domain-containing protein [Longimicrobiaceae bacterium]